MKLMPHEKIIDEHKDLTLTNLRLVQEKEGLGFKHFKEIPLKNFDSMKFSSKINLFLLLLAIISLIIAGVTLTNAISNDFENDAHKYSIVAFLLSMLIFLTVFLTREEIIKFRSRSTTIVENKKGVMDFVHKLRSQIY